MTELSDLRVQMANIETRRVCEEMRYGTGDPRLRFGLLWVLASLILCFPCPASAGEGTDFFETKIRPVLVENCYRCHSADAQKQGKLKGKLTLDTRAGIRKGGETGPAIVPGKVDDSKLAAVDDADAVTLIRRLYFDLIGLPPSPEDIDEFEKSAIHNPNSAIENLVDQLLESPQFGERWGRHWLDVARFAESNGATKNTIWPDAWRYRDYVIDSFNAAGPSKAIVSLRRT